MTDIAPIKLSPAFRFGKDTPWGGRNLRTLCGKDIPSDITGESLEASCLPNLNSVCDDGSTLSNIITKYGERILGSRANGEFPLLLKLIDARDRLSVQTHPNDEYARIHEGGKRGKSEAWVILRAEQGASIVYGLKPGVTRDAYKQAVADGEAENLLNVVPVKAGDVFHITPGVVHAIGAGVLLYEIQQSSDVTYRLYDYNRVAVDGKLRELHVDKALDTLTDTTPNAPVVGEVQEVDGGERIMYISEGYFALEKLVSRGMARFDAAPDSFELLMPLTPCEIRYSFDTLGSFGSLNVAAYETVLIPSDIVSYVIRGAAEVLRAFVPRER